MAEEDDREVKKAKPWDLSRKLNVKGVMRKWAFAMIY
jgi:hypothetical protein